MQLELVSYRDITPTIRTFRFQPEQPLHFTAGQYADFYLPHPEADQRGTHRWFTISSSPDEPFIEVTVRRAHHQGSSFKQALWQLQPGTRWQASIVQGDFVLPLDTSRPIILVAVGLGITPFMSMLSWLSHNPEPYQLHLFHAYSMNHETTGRFIPDNQLQSLAKTSVHLPRLQKDSLPQQLTSLVRQQAADNSYYYIAGSESSVNNIRRLLRADGIAGSDIVTDAFLGY